SPTTLGVLAHELTHVARARQPRFVPPIVRDAAAATSQPVMRPATLDTSASEASVIEEEPMALRAESAVRHAARREPGSTIDSPRPIPESIEPFAGSTRRAPLYDRPDTRNEALAPTPRSADDNGERDASPWGGLPAPWEPLPEALSQMSAPSVNGAEPGIAATLNGGDGFAPATSPPATAPTAAPAAAPVQAAARDRSIADQTAAAPAAAAAGQAIGNPPAPDIDALARQVYDVLKRRLAAERRRGG
ncbi:MAG: hypothetical protein ACM37U_03215, partial [Gemmatimonas sp.]